MSPITSTMAELGMQAPDFSLQDVVGGETVSRADFEGQPLLVMFLCRHCPSVKHIEREVARIGDDYAGRLGIVAIGANDPAISPDDAPEGLAEQAERLKFIFPYLFDETQEVARSFGAACTPDFFLFGHSHRLVYRGQLDSSRPGNDVPVTGGDLRAAIEAILAHQEVNPDQRPSAGCGIKWAR